MPYAIVADKIAKIAPQYRGELLAFIAFLLYRQNTSGPAKGVTRKFKKVFLTLFFSFFFRFSLPFCIEGR